jgi:hypothetical protein
LEYLINHVFLPPKVPQEDDYNADYERLLLKVVLDALTIFKRHIPTDWLSATESVMHMVKDLENMLDNHGFINEKQLKELLKGRCVTGRDIWKRGQEDLYASNAYTADCIKVEHYYFTYANKTVG